MVGKLPAENKPSGWWIAALSLSVAAGPDALAEASSVRYPAGEPAAEAPPAPSPEKSFELIPFVAWAQTGAMTSLVGTPPEPVPLPLKGLPVLKELREKAERSPGFTARAFATADDVAAFESSFGEAYKTASRDPKDAPVFARQLVDAADGLKEDSGLRRLLLVRALTLILPQAEGQEDLEKIGSKLRASLSVEVPADLTAVLLLGEALASHPGDAGAGAAQARREAVRDARWNLLDFQVRNGYLEEAGESLPRALREAGSEASEDLKGLRKKLDARLALRERYRKLLRDAEARPDDGTRYRELALFILSALHDEELASAAARKADHPALKAYAEAGTTGAGRASMARTERLVDLIPLASAADRPGLAQFASQRIDELAAGATGPDAERIQALRERLAVALRQDAHTQPGVFVRVPARTAWVPSGYQVKKGRRYHLTAEGKWSAGKGQGDAEVDAAGAGGPPATQGRFPLGALVAQVGFSLDTILIGRELFLTAPETGELFFCMNEAFRDFDDNTGEVVVRIEAPPDPEVIRPVRPAEFIGRWNTVGQGKKTTRDLLGDGTCSTGAVKGTWVARNAKEAVLRWSNGAVERMAITVPGKSASLHGNSGRPFTLAKEASEEKTRSP
jgi:hypothetical protein